MRQDNKKLSIFALGGVSEIGKNMFVIEYDREILVIDAGLKFPEAEMLGVDRVIPDMSYLIENKEKVRGVIITHGHEDQMGALPYLLKHVQVPVYASKFTLGLIELKLKEAGMLKGARLREVSSESIVNFQRLKASFFRTNHSIPDSLGVCVDTPEGKVVYTGDFKFDPSPVDGRSSDYGALSRLGDEGVLVLLSDSTNADQPGFTRSESKVGEAIEKEFGKASGRIIVATYATNIHRIQQALQAAERFGRKAAIVGKSMADVVRVARQLGYIEIKEDLLLDYESIQKLPPEKTVLLVTGAQGEPISALHQMARSAHRQVDIVSGDTVMIASSPIAGDERLVGRVIDQLYRIGADVVYGPDIHVSGHGSQEELKLMLNLVKPKYFIPVRGEYRMLRAHALIAEQVGVRPENIFLLNNGDTVEFFDQKARLGLPARVGQLLVDGLGVGDVGNIVLRDRKSLSQDGILVIVVTLCKRTGAILSGPNIISRGFVYVRESEKLMDEANELVTQILTKCLNEKVKEWSFLKTNVRDALGRFLYDKTKRRPMILPIIMEA